MSKHEERKPIGFVRAVVEFPLYEGDVTERETFNDFIYEEPGITERGELGVCRRDCKTLSFEIVRHVTE